MQDFPVDPDVQRRLAGLAFEGPAKRIYETVVAVNLSATAEELRELLRGKLFNESQQRTQRASFYAMRWAERNETVEQFGTRPSAAALALPEEVAEEVLIHRFVEGLPSRLRDKALLVGGTYDEVVAKTSMVSGASQSRGAFEPVRATYENEPYRTTGYAGRGSV